MGPVITTFVYKDIEDALKYSTYYSDILRAYKTDFDNSIGSNGEYWVVEFTIYGSNGRKNKSGDSKRTRYLPKSSPENS